MTVALFRLRTAILRLLVLLVLATLPQLTPIGPIQTAIAQDEGEGEGAAVDASDRSLGFQNSVLERAAQAERDQYQPAGPIGRATPETMADSLRALLRDTAAARTPAAMTKAETAAVELIRQSKEADQSIEARAWLALARLRLTRAQLPAAAAPPGTSPAAKGQSSVFAGVGGAAYAAYSITQVRSVQAEALGLIGRAAALTAKDELQWLVAREALDASLSRQPDVELDALADQAAQKIGLKLLKVEPHAKSAQPLVCLQFNDVLLRRTPTALAEFVTVAPPVQIGLETNADSLCVRGLQFGRAYTLTVKPGLSSKRGAQLAKAEERRVTLPDREAQIAFRGNGYVLPRVGAKGLPLLTVNVTKVDLKLLRVHDRNVARQIVEGNWLQSLEYYQIQSELNQAAVTVFSGTTEPKGEKNADVVSALPLETMLGERKPAVYVMVAGRPGTLESCCENTVATQWVLVSDLGLITFQGEDGLTVLARSLATGKPVKGADISVVSRANEPLGTAKTDGDGVARLAAGLLRGTRGNAPAIVTIQGADGDYGVLDLTRAAFDLSDRGVGGRPAVTALEAVIFGERGIWRPGETARVTVLLRDDAGRAAGRAVTLKLVRPDGAPDRTLLMPAEAAGMAAFDIPINANAATGRWMLSAYLDPKGKPIGELGMLVEDFVPPLIEVAAKPAAPQLRIGDVFEVPIEARFLTGAAADRLPAQADVVIEADTAPFPELPGFVFGLAQEQVTPLRKTLDLAATDAQGRTVLKHRVDVVPKSSGLLRARFTASVFEPSGRPVNATVTVPLRGSRDLVGLKPGFTGGQLPSGSVAEVDVLTLDSAGAKVARTLTWELYEETYDYLWFRRDGRGWRWETTRRDMLRANGTLKTDASGIARLALPAQSWGRFRLEVATPNGETVSGLHVDFGWGGTASSTVATPDRMGVGLDKASYRPGETAKVRLEPPFAGEVVLTMLNDKVHAVRQVTVPAEGATIDLDLPGKAGDPTFGAWGTGVYVTAVALRPAGAEAPRGPARAIGLAWLPIDPAARTLAVALTAPAQIRPGDTLDLPLAVKRPDGQPATKARVTLAAVDDGVLQLTRFQSPQPDTLVFAKRRLAIDIRDLYGNLIDGREGQPAQVRSGGDEAGRAAPAPSVKSSRVVALWSGLLTLDTKGETRVKFAVPAEFEGRLRIMAVAADADALGHAEAMTLVREPLSLSLAMPRFLAPGDRSAAVMSMANLELPAGPVTLAINAEGAIALVGAVERKFQLGGPGSARISEPIQIQAAQGEATTGRLAVTVSGPGGFKATRSAEIGLRPGDPVLIKRSMASLEAGKSLALDGALLADRAGGRGQVVVTASSGPNFEVASLLRALDRYPYGCLEQTTSRALPLLYLAEVARASSAAPVDAAAINQRVAGALARVLTMQRVDGSFGLWSSASPAEPWLTGYVLDFMTRAREEGHTVDKDAFARGIDWLKQSLTSAASPSVLTDRAYAWYVLARNKEITAGSLRAAAQAHLSGLPTPLARAQLAAALALVGDNARAAEAFAQAGLDPGVKPQAKDQPELIYASYGTSLRETAAVLALAIEAGPKVSKPETLFAAAERAEARLADPATGVYLSTQEQSWLLLAAHAVAKGAVPVRLGVDGVTLTTPRGPVAVTVAPDRLAKGTALLNQGTTPLSLSITTEGFPIGDLPAEGKGFKIERRWKTVEGKLVDPAIVAQGTRLVVEIEVTAEAQVGSRARALVVDLLPAGFEAEAGSFGDQGGTAAIGWATPWRNIAYQGVRDDRYVAQLDMRSGQTATLYYVLRAVTPGDVRRPAVFVEDMYRPFLQARGTTGRSKVVER